MPSAENIKDDGRFLGLFVGRSGSGKSAAAYSFPKPLKVLDLDGRLRGGLVPWNDPESGGKKGIEYEYFPPKPDGKTVFQMLNDSFLALQIMLKTGTGVQYKTLVLDSITWETIDLLLDAISLTHGVNAQGETKGRSVGPFQLSGPEDYKFQSTGTYQTLAFLKSFPIPNIIVTAHITPKWVQNPNDKYGPNIMDGEQLSLTDKLAENVPSSFDHVFRFEKEDTGKEIKFYFQTHGSVARSAFDLPYGKMDITKVKFYDFLMKKAGVTL